MANNYYSGQGSLYIAERDAATGAPKGFIAVGNVPEMTIDIETDTLEHKESESGSRLTDLVIVKEKKGTFSFKLENMSLDNLALALWGTAASVTGASVVDEVVKAYKSTATVKKNLALANPDVSAVIVKDTTGTTTYVLGTDYTVDAKNGTISIISTSAIVEAADLKVSYTFAAHNKVDAFTSAAAPERWLRFEGLNTVDNSRVIVDIFKAQFDPMTGYGLLNEELGSADMKGTILADLTKTVGSQFFSQKNVAA